MIKIERINVMNIDNAIHGMRNPLESWDKSDSFICDECHGGLCEFSLPNHRSCYAETNINSFVIGEKDLNLAQRMIGAGSDESKFMRQIFVTMDIDAPLYWWKEMDTYKVATVANSCSTMHKLATTPITRDCFSFDEELETIEDIKQYIDEEGGYLTFSETIIRNCEQLRRLYIETKDKRYWRALIQLLPESWNQKRTWTANYQVLRNIYFARRNHKLQEWREFTNRILILPYGKELITIE